MNLGSVQALFCKQHFSCMHEEIGFNSVEEYSSREIGAIELDRMKTSLLLLVNQCCYFSSQNIVNRECDFRFSWQTIAN